ncbi:hypothetical protein ABI59_06195 [Acidobacteria bacterium Mor1]|nr:hypothetical protein ABI59_06195 [Acidobacteria bacterium Mor1]
MKRAAAIAAGLAALTLYALLAVSVFRAGGDPQQSGLLGPEPRELTRRAEALVQQGVDALQDDTLSAQDRYGTFREKLQEAEQLLERSLRANPAQARALTTLASVRFELDPPERLDGPRAMEILELTEAAAELAPRVPSIHLRLGRVLMAMGHEERGGAMLLEGLDGDPERAPEVLAFLRQRGWSATELQQSFGTSPTMLLGLGPAFAEEGRVDDYLQALEDHPHFSGRIFLKKYGNVGLEAGRAARVRDRLKALHPLDESRDEAERLAQLARAEMESGDPRSAVPHAARAATLAPGDRRMIEIHAGALHQAGQPVEAIDAYRRLLQLFARQDPGSDARAGTYRRIGQAYETAGDMHAAFEAYRQALTLNPEEPVARRRLEARGTQPGI